MILIKNMFKNLFERKKINKQEELPKNEIEEIREEPEEKEDFQKKGPILEGLDLKERLRVLSEKKEEIDVLQERRREFYIEAKNLEDKMIALGISDEHKKEIKTQIAFEGQAISDKIIEIKEKYGLEATPVEVLSLRFKMIKAEMDRIKENLQEDRERLEKIIENDLKRLRSFPKDEEAYKQDTSSSIKAGYLTEYNNIIKKLEKEEFEKFPEVAEFLKGHEENINESSFSTDKLQKRCEDINILIEGISGKTNAFYKTLGEKEKASIKFLRLAKLLGEIESDLEQAQNKSGRFVER